MNSLSRAALVTSHLVVLGLAMVAGLEMGVNRTLVSPSEKTPAALREGSKPVTTEPPYSTAWESLKDRPLPRLERLAIQETLLREWSMTDLESSLHAALDEAPGDQENLLKACSPGILAHRSQAWDLVMSRVFGWETARLRSLWITLIAENEPNKLFPKLRDMPPAVRVDALQHLTTRWWESEDQALRDKLWAGLQEHVSTANGETFANVAQWLGAERPLEDLLPELRRGTTPAGRRLAAASVGLALDALPPEDFVREFDRIPEEQRTEVAAAALAVDDAGIELTLLYAQLALAGGQVDDLAAAASREGFRSFCENTEDPSALVDWAFTLPDDPRVLELYRQVLRGADRFSFDEAANGIPTSNFDALLAKVEKQPPGWQRDHGLAVLAPRGRYRRKSDDEIRSLLGEIQDSGLRTQATREYQDQLAKERPEEQEFEAESPELDAE